MSTDLSFSSNPSSLSITAQLSSHEMQGVTIQQAVRYVAEKIGDAILEKYKDEIMADITPKIVTERAQQLVAEKLASQLSFEIKP